MTSNGKNESEEVKISGKDEEKEKAIYACLACKAIFKDAGMCPNCNLVLKKKAA